MKRQPANVRVTVFISLLSALVFGICACGETQTSGKAVVMKTSGAVSTAYFAGGCFWCVEAVFARHPGVLNAVSGYAGGTLPDPTYDQVTSGNTGHAETVRVDFDPALTSYEMLLELFFRAHDPTTRNRQGADVGTQYRSAIFYTDEAQKQAAQRALEAAQREWQKPVVTEIMPLSKFYPAEDYHQDYFEKNPHGGYCAIVIRPKLKKLGLE